MAINFLLSRLVLMVIYPNARFGQKLEMIILMGYALTLKERSGMQMSAINIVSVLKKGEKCYRQLKWIVDVLRVYSVEMTEQFYSLLQQNGKRQIILQEIQEQVGYWLLKHQHAELDGPSYKCFLF